MIDRYISSGFGQANSSDLNSALPALRRIYRDLLPTDRISRVLDLGCGMGHFLNFLMAEGYQDILGVDIGSEQVKAARQVTPNVKLVGDSIAFLKNERECWDCIVMKDVIEHVPHSKVVATFGACRQALRPGGRLLIETGNLASFSGVYLRYKDFTHESGFTEDSLAQVLRAGGFNQIMIQSTDGGIISPRALPRFLLQHLWHLALRTIYWIERGPGLVPHHLDKLLVAVAIRD